MVFIEVNGKLFSYQIQVKVIQLKVLQGQLTGREHILRGVAIRPIHRASELGCVPVTMAKYLGTDHLISWGEGGGG